MTVATNAYNEGGTTGGKNSDWSGPPGPFTVAHTVAMGVKYKKLLNRAQYLTVYNWGVGVMKFGFNNTALKGINGDHTVSVLTAGYFYLPPGGYFSQPVQFDTIFFKALADTEYSVMITLSEEKAGTGEMTGADQFDIVEEMDPLRTDFT